MAPRDGLAVADLGAEQIAEHASRNALERESSDAPRDHPPPAGPLLEDRRREHRLPRRPQLRDRVAGVYCRDEDTRHGRPGSETSWTGNERGGGGSDRGRLRVRGRASRADRLDKSCRRKHSSNRERSDPSHPADASREPVPRVSTRGLGARALPQQVDQRVARSGATRCIGTERDDLPGRASLLQDRDGRPGCRRVRRRASEAGIHSRDADPRHPVVGRGRRARHLDERGHRSSDSRALSRRRRALRKDRRGENRSNRDDSEDR
jgi:hypothetical protein